MFSFQKLLKEKLNSDLLGDFFSASGIGKLKQLAIEIEGIEQPLLKAQIVKAKEFADRTYAKVEKFTKDKDFDAAIEHIKLLSKRIDCDEQKAIFADLMIKIDDLKSKTTFKKDPDTYALRSTEEKQLEDACKAFGNEISLYSKNVAASICSIIHIIINHNGISLLSQKDHITKLCNVIDNYTATFSPEICNDHSYELANCLYKFIESIDFKNESNDKNDFVIDLDAKFVKEKIDLKKIIIDVKNNLQYKIDVYNMLQAGIAAKAEKQEILSHIDEQFDAVVEQGFAALLKTYENV
ncbi:MAG: hypothetical protein JO149_07410, partial [Gammaproteobacteria bacterium]|nr:hypothetical protein [Gammaproteobacteria bacterium]